MATRIFTSGESKTVTPENGRAFTLEELQKFVGGYIEFVKLKAGDTMVVNEEGLLKDLSPNELASTLAGGIIVGDVVILSTQELHDADGEDDGDFGV